MEQFQYIGNVRNNLSLKVKEKHKVRLSIRSTDSVLLSFKDLKSGVEES